jgi:hypothetical protein
MASPCFQIGHENESISKHSGFKGTRRSGLKLPGIPKVNSDLRTRENNVRSCLTASPEGSFEKSIICEGPFAK